ncbi:MAG: magnesium transporter [Bacillota bacterium]
MAEFTDQLLIHIKNKAVDQIHDLLTAHHPSDVVDAFLSLDIVHQDYLIKTLKPSLLADMFEYFEEETAKMVLQTINKNKGADVLSHMEPDDATDILQYLEPEDSEDYLELMDQVNRDTLAHLLTYQEDTAGAIMTTDFIVLHKDMDVKDAMKTLVHGSSTPSLIRKLFVLDNNGFLEGVVHLKTLIQARTPKAIKDIMITEVTTVHAEDSAEGVARMMQNYAFYLMPVVNDENRMLGVITLDDAADILDEATDEDYGQFAMIDGEQAIDDTFMHAAFHRLPWLIILLVLGIFISLLMSFFEATIDKIAVLIIFQPLILGMAGNTGTQSLAVTVRGISKAYFDDKAYKQKHVIKELKIGLINGLFIGLISLLTTYLFLTITSPTMDLGTPLDVGLTVGASAFIALAFASTFGAFLPLLLHKIHIDPAVASGPFMTTLNDIIGLVIYFTLAIIIIL